MAKNRSYQVSAQFSAEPLHAFPMYGRDVSPNEAAIEREWKLTRIRNQIKISNWNVAPRYPSARAQKHRSGRR